MSMLLRNITGNDDLRHLSILKAIHLAKRSKTKLVYVYFQWLLTEDSMTLESDVSLDFIFNTKVAFPSFFVE